MNKEIDKDYVGKYLNDLIKYLKYNENKPDWWARALVRLAVFCDADAVTKELIKKRGMK